MNDEYNILSKEWNGKPKTVLSYTKQIKLYKLIIKQYPTPKDLKEKLLSMDNSNSKILGYYINEDWSDEHYKKFILANIVKYTSIGKTIISTLVGGAAGILAGFYTHKYLWEPKNQAKAKENKLTPEEQDKWIEDEKKRLIGQVDPFHYKNIASWGTGFSTKGLTTLGTYKFLDYLDKKNAEKNA